jgi:hypothetical protein
MTPPLLFYPVANVRKASTRVAEGNVRLIANAWYPKTATATISLTSTELSQPSYALAYLCTWTGSQWKCGCRDSACTQSYWQIQQFKR